MRTAKEAELAYRKAFVEFSKKVQEVQALTADPHPDAARLEKALLALEQAHVAYSARRDQWVAHLLPSASHGPQRARQSETRSAHEDCVRAIAELLWEGAGRPEGTAEENWRKAEEIVKQAALVA
jgi:sugar phosphate isomerase/epimerase